MEPLATTGPAPESTGKAVKAAHINVRTSSIDKQLIEAKAKKAGLTTSDFMRRAALGRSLTEKVPTDLRRQIALVGSHLTQLTRLANAGKLSGASTEQLNQVVAALLLTLK